MNTKHSKSHSLHYYGVIRGRLPQRAGSLGLNGGGRWGCRRGTPVKNRLQKLNTTRPRKQCKIQQNKT